ncbi:amino acid--tRNA ligase-related protein [Achromobacter xylosoxidans]
MAFTDCQLRAMRSAFYKARFTEVLTPALEVITVRDTLALETSLAGQTFALSISPDPWLEQCLSVKDRVFSIAKAFREDSIDTVRLAEFHYAQFWMYASLEDAMSLLEFIFSKMFNELDTQLVLAGQSVPKPDFCLPFPRMTYNDAALSIGKTSADKLNRDDYINICARHGSPVFVLHFPPEHEPRLEDAVKLKEGSQELLENFELIAPFAGEVGSGREVLVSASQDATVCAGIGLERMAQYFLSESSIVEASSLQPIATRVYGGPIGRG